MMYLSILDMAKCCRTILLTPNTMPITYDVWSLIFRHDLHIITNHLYTNNTLMAKALGRYDKENEKNGRYTYRHETGDFYIGFNNSGGFWQVLKQPENVQFKYYFLF